jgi:hypothetical protein
VGDDTQRGEEAVSSLEETFYPVIHRSLFLYFFKKLIPLA